MFFPFGNRLFQKSSRLHERSLNKQGDCTMTVLEKEGIALEVLDKNRVATPCSGQPWARLWDQFWEFCVFMSCWCRFWHRFRYHVWCLLGDFRVTFWRRRSLLEGYLDFVEFAVSLTRELQFRGLEGSRGDQHSLFFRLFFGRWFWDRLVLDFGFILGGFLGPKTYRHQCKIWTCFLEAQKRDRSGWSSTARALDPSQVT